MVFELLSAHGSVVLFTFGVGAVNRFVFIALTFKHMLCQLLKRVLFFFSVIATFVFKHKAIYNVSCKSTNLFSMHGAFRSASGVEAFQREM